MSEFNRTKSLLLVDDSREDIDLVLRAMKQLGIVCEIATALDGEEALNHLKGSGTQTDATGKLPDLVLLDLQMPKINGHEVLRQVRNDTKLSGIPIIVMSTSSREEDIANSYVLGANGYVVKPVEAHELIESIRQISEFWLERNETPQT